MRFPDIRDLDAAEAACQRSLELRDPNDALGRSRCIKQIGMVHHERFREAGEQDQPPETLAKHGQAAEEHYQQALDLCPASAIADLGPMHGQLGMLYAQVGQAEDAREHLEKAAQCFEQTGDRYRAGVVRHNIANMYADAAEREETPARRRDLFLRAEAYAQAALRDFQHYEGRAAADEAKAEQLLDRIGKALAKL